MTSSNLHHLIVDINGVKSRQHLLCGYQKYKTAITCICTGVIFLLQRPTK